MTRHDILCNMTWYDILCHSIIFAHRCGIWYGMIMIWYGIIWYGLILYDYVMIWFIISALFHICHSLSNMIWPMIWNDFSFHLRSLDLCVSLCDLISHATHCCWTVLSYKTIHTIVIMMLEWHDTASPCCLQRWYEYG